MPAPADTARPDLARPPGSPWPFDTAAGYLAVSVRHLMRLADMNRVKTIRLGRRRLIPDAEIQRLASEGV